ncbi:MAG: MFS transporter [Deferribacteres bacterium]|nr:MFS transporter [Deferribacteres bacterium]
MPKYTARKVRKRGKKDGRNWEWRFFPPKWPFQVAKESDPPIEQEAPTEFEKELLEGAEQNLSRLVQEWSDTDRRLHRHCTDAEDVYNRTKSAVEKESGEHNEAIEHYKTAKEDYYKLPMPNISASLFWVVFIIITAAEISFNGLVFKIFGQGRVHTYLMAIGLMAAIPWLSDFLGKKLRHEKKNKTTIGLMIASGLIVFAGLSVIAILREKFFEANKVVEALGISWDSRSIIFIFAVVNVLLFAAIVVLAYEAGHRNPSEHRRLKMRLKDAARKLKEDAGSAEKAAKQFADARIAFNKAHAEREHAFEMITARAEEERDKWISLIQIYRAANMEARRSKEKPRSFNIDLESLIQMPEEFRSLDCGSCCYDRERE